MFALDLPAKTAAQLETLADRFGLEPEQIAEEAVALAATMPECFERWLAGQSFTVERPAA